MIAYDTSAQVSASFGLQNTLPHSQNGSVEADSKTFGFRFPPAGHNRITPTVYLEFDASTCLQTSSAAIPASNLNKPARGNIRVFMTQPSLLLILIFYTHKYTHIPSKSCRSTHYGYLPLSGTKRNNASIIQSYKYVHSEHRD